MPHHKLNPYYQSDLDFMIFFFFSFFFFLEFDNYNNGDRGFEPRLFVFSIYHITKMTFLKNLKLYELKCKKG